MKLRSGILISALAAALAVLLANGPASATVLADRARLSEAEGLALEFLSADLVQRWASAELGRNGI
jgi:hypothetical protein